MIDEVRFRRLYDENYAALMGYALRRAPADDAPDIVAETFLIAWRRMQDVPEGDSARLWLYGTARRVVANHARSSTRRLRLAERIGSMASQDMPGPCDADGDSAAVGRAFGRLNEKDREVLLLVGWEDLDAGEIGQVLGVSRGAVRVRLHRARTRFARELQSEGVKRPAAVGHIQNRWATARPGVEESL